ncbi:MAG: hypothetical protein DRJ03_30335, partial [Chloroflexi bacterium]
LGENGMKKEKWKNITLTIAILITLVVAGYVPPSMGKETPLVTVKVDPKHTWIAVGSTFSINVTVKDAVGLLGYDIQLAYNTTMLDGIDIDIKPFIPDQIIIKEEIDDAAGNIWVIVSSSDPTGVSGNGTLFAVTFNCTGLGYSLLDLHDVELSATVPYDIEVKDGDVLQALRPHGPRSDLEFIWGYFSPDEAFSALLNGDVDIFSMGLTKEQFEAAQENPDVQVAAFTKNEVSKFATNTNETISDYPHSLNPLRLYKVRRAIAHLIDKDFIITEILKGFGARIDAPVAYPQTEGWVDPSVVTYDWNHNGIIEPEEDNYPYKYDLNTTVQLLASIGFNDTDGNGYLNYPDDPMWMDAAGKDTTEMPLKICITSDDPWRLMAGRYLYHQLEGDPAVAGDSPLATANWPEGFVGGDWDTTDETYVKDRSVLSPIVFGDRNYHIYTYRDFVPRFPYYLYFMFHSDYWGKGNIETDYNFPDLDSILEKLIEAQSIEEAQEASKNATRYIIGKCIGISLWSYTGYQAWRKEIVGIVNMVGYGINNQYTYLNAFHANDPSAPLRIAVERPSSLNPIYTVKRADWKILDAVYPRLIAFNPYNLAVDQPWVAQDWEVNKRRDTISNNEKIVVTFYLRKDVGIVAPVSGELMGFYNAYDLNFTIWQIKNHWEDSPLYPLVKNVNATEIVNDYTIKIYFNSSSIWNLYKIAELPLLPEDELQKAVGSFIDYPPYGFYLWEDYGFSWEDTMYTIGSHYPTSIDKTLGAHLKGNRFFFLETPILGEVDWRWYWDTPGGVPGWENPGRDYGYYKIDILDVIFAAAAYCTRGDGIYNPVYMPGADLDTTDLCHIGILDVLVITSHYGETFGRPPPDP